MKINKDIPQREDLLNSLTDLKCLAPEQLSAVVRCIELRVTRQEIEHFLREEFVTEPGFPIDRSCDRIS